MQLKYKKKVLWIFILLIPFFKPTYTEIIPNADLIYKLLLWGIMYYIVINYFYTKRKPSNILFAFLAFEMYMLLITYINGGDTKSALLNAEQIMTFVAVFDFYSDKIEYFLRASMLHFEICIYINFLTVVLCPNGFFSRLNNAYGATHEWFLGAPNNFVVWLFPGLVFAWIYKNYMGNSKRCYLLTTVAALTELINGSGTGKMAVTIFILYLIFPFAKKIFTPIRSMVVAVTVFLIIVIFQRYDILQPIIVGILHKDMTLSNRIYIWNNAIVAIKEKFLFGHGILKSDDMISYLGNLGGLALWEGATHCHCHFLQVMFQGGLVGILLLTLIYFVALRPCIKNKKYVFAQLGIWAIVTFTIIGITEVFDNVLMYSIFALAFFAAKISEKYRPNGGHVIHAE